MEVKRQQQKFNLKKEMNFLLKELGVSKRSFKQKMPRVIGEGLDFILPSDQKFSSKDKVKKGKKPSLRQQVEYLRRMLESYKEMKKFIDEEVKKYESSKKDETNSDNKEAEQVDAVKEPLFKL